MMTNDARSYTRAWSGKDPSFLTLRDGSKLRYLKIGTGEPLVLIHTVRTQLDLFQRLIPKLTGRYTVYALDLPGFGWSDIVPSADYTEPTLRAKVLELIETLGLQEATLVGESIGAVLALTLSTEPAMKPKRVVAINAYDYLPGLERANLLAWFIIKSVRAPIVGRLFAAMENRAILSGIVSGGFHDPRRLPTTFVDELSRSGARSGYSRVARSVYRALPSFVSARSRYPTISVPVTLVFGGDDWSRLSERKADEAIIPGAKLITIDDTGHFASMESPEACAQIILGEANA